MNLDGNVNGKVKPIRKVSNESFVTAYDSQNQTGNTLEITQDISDLSSLQWSDKIKSIQII
jgi:hypothetical protein